MLLSSPLFGPFGIERLDQNKEEMYILVHLGLVKHKEKDRYGHGYDIRWYGYEIQQLDKQ